MNKNKAVSKEKILNSKLSAFFGLLCYIFTCLVCFSPQLCFKRV